MYISYQNSHIVVLCKLGTQDLFKSECEILQSRSQTFFVRNFFYDIIFAVKPKQQTNNKIVLQPQV